MLDTMERPSERMRLKDKIIDNISKAIKAIQEVVYYQSKDPVLSGSPDGVVLRNGDRPCHKLCENLDHAFLHGLKNVTHGYWRVVRQLSHKGMIKEIDFLQNVTTDLGRGRAWLYATLNEGLLESYIRLLSDNDKLLKKYYAKEALVLDGDRMNVILTLTSGLDFVTFKLEFDLPYLDLNAYPPRSRTDSEVEGDVMENTLMSRINTSGSFRSEISASSPDSTTRLPSDSDSASLASLDVHTHIDQTQNMRTSTISADSGFPVDSMFSNSLKQRSITPTENNGNSKLRSETPIDTISISSFGSTGDPDRIQRLESIVAIGEEDDDGNGDSLEVIRIKSKRGVGNKSKKKKQVPARGNSIEKTSIERGFSEPKQSDSQIISSLSNGECGQNVCLRDEKKTGNGAARGGDSPVLKDGNTISVNGKEMESLDSTDESAALATMPQYDSGVDICGLASMGEKSSPSSSSLHTDIADFGSSLPEEKNALSKPGVFVHASVEPKSALAQIESKIAELCNVDASEDSSISSHTEVPHGSGKMPNATLHSSDPKPNHFNSDINALHTDAHPPGESKSSSQAKPLLSDKTSLSDHSSQTVDSTKNSSQVSEPAAIANFGTNKLKPPESTFENSPKRDRIHGSADTQGNEPGNECKNGTDNLSEPEEDFDFYSAHASAREWSPKEPKPAGASANISSVQEASHLQDYMDFILQGQDSPPEGVDRQELQEKEEDFSLSLDNNTRLQVMLDIFTHEDEQFLKMFVTRENHTEGEAGVIYVLISDYNLYLLHYKQSLKKFVLHSRARLVDLIFISTGLYEQTLNIESREKNKQKQRLWLTPGHQALTQAILTCLTDAVKAANENVKSVRSRFSVGSEVPLQKIALRKYISKELHCEQQDVTICDYSLVFWEDPAATNHLQPDHAYREGTLLLQTQDPLKGYVWKPVYVVLKNSTLCMSNNKSDSRPHSILGLGGSQCVGCRLTSLADREHCVELVLAQGGSWFLSAASQNEIAEWRHSLCLAVSQGTVENNTLAVCVPSCAVLSCNQLFLCHEDLHTKFYRTLGRAQLEDVTGIAMDEEDASYCVIEFESQEAGVTSNQWVFYFSSPQDLNRHKNALSTAWKEIFQIDLPVLPLDNVALQRHCRSHANQLRQHLALR